MKNFPPISIFCQFAFVLPCCICVALFYLCCICAANLYLWHHVVFVWMDYLNRFLNGYPNGLPNGFLNGFPINLASHLGGLPQGWSIHMSLQNIVCVWWCQWKQTCLGIFPAHLVSGLPGTRQWFLSVTGCAYLCVCQFGTNTNWPPFIASQWKSSMWIIEYCILR